MNSIKNTFKVMKFGGTSVGTPDRMKAILALLDEQQPTLIVLSAVAGTTNQLVNIAEHLHQKNTSAALLAIEKLEQSYIHWPDALFAQKEDREEAKQFLKAHFSHLRSFTLDLFTTNEENSILATGELISTGLFHRYLVAERKKACLIPALDFMRLDADGEPDTQFIQQALHEKLAACKESWIVTQGFICRNAYGEIANLKRGGSDYSASIIGAAINARIIEIWTDIDGMHNNDPRIIANTRPVRKLSFDEAAELAYFGAKILHPSSVWPARKAGIPVLLKNTMEPHAAGTLISNERSGKSITAIAAKDAITVIKIKSGRMLMAYGFLRRVFEVFERYKTPIDVITTSEVAVSLTIDQDGNLEHIQAELNDFGTVEIDRNQCIICVVGDMLAERKGHASQVFQALEQIPIRMISYGGSDNNISFVVNQNHKQDALKALHLKLFSNDIKASALS